MICVLKVVEGPAAGMKCWLKPDQRISIGRVSSADFSVSADPHMSRNHLIVEGVGTAFRLRDVGSSNGTYVNDSRISMVELCGGDRIQAGTSVFRVEFVEEQGRQPREEPAVQPAESPTDFPIPTRTLNSEELEFDQEVTRRYPATTEASDSITLPTDPVPETLRKPEPAEENTAGSIPSAFLAEFPSDREGWLHRQSGPASRAEQCRILDLLLAAGGQTHFSLVVNRHQIDDVENGAIDFAISTGESRALTSTLCLLQSDKPEFVLEFFKRCLAQDAAICIASQAPLPDAWLHEALDVLSYPSLLFSMVSQSKERAAQLSSGIDFLLFEPNGDGDLCLLQPIDP